MPEKKVNSTLNPAVWVVLVISLLANAYFLYNSFSLKNSLTEQSETLQETQQLHEELEKQFYEAMADLDEMKSENEELNALIETQKDELKVQKNKVNSLLKDSKNLVAARSELKKLRMKAQENLAEVTRLQEENTLLSSENQKLTVVKMDLEKQVETEQLEKSELQTAKASLVSERDQLQIESQELKAKVNLASIIKVDNILVTGFKTRNDGKDIEKNRAKSVNRLEICFETVDNIVAEPGKEDFYMILRGPSGETLSMQGLGSGVMINNETGEQLRFTGIKSVKFENNILNSCMNWEPNVPFDAGSYAVEIYNKGYLSGKTQFALK